MPDSRWRVCRSIIASFLLAVSATTSTPLLTTLPGGTAQARLRQDQTTPQSFLSGPWRVSVVEAIQAPAIEGVVSSNEDGIEWIVIVADVLNWSASSATLDLADLSLSLGSPSSSQPAQAVAIADVNLRAGPGTDTPILGGVPEGSTVTVLGQAENGFLPVDVAGQQGWIFADFLSVSRLPGSGSPAAAVDLDATQVAADILGLAAGSQVVIEPETAARVAIAFPIPPGTQDYALAIGDESLQIEAEQRAALDPGALPDQTDAPSLVDVEVLDVTGGRSLEGKDEAGATIEVELFGIETPVGNECWADRAEEELRTLVGNAVSLEAVGDQYLVWANTASAESPRLVNYAMVEEGTAAVLESGDQSPFGSWTSTAQELAQDEERGLWGACTGVHGTEKPRPTPTPTPTPSAAELRAQYVVLPDVRELAIRPGNMLGDKIAFTGEIFTIQVATPDNVFVLGDTGIVTGSAAMQIWVSAPDGTREAVFVAYDGDTSGMFEGTWVTVYGTVEGTQSGTNLMGGEITQPLVKADIIDFA